MKAKTWDQLAQVFLEVYHTRGPVDLLAIVIELSRACFDLAIIRGELDIILFKHA
jgi:hypothetical protein